MQACWLNLYFQMEPVDLDDQKLVMDHQKLVTELAYLVSTLEDGEYQKPLTYQI